MSTDLQKSARSAKWRKGCLFNNDIGEARYPLIKE